jgi:predicted transcriptional regulator
LVDLYDITLKKIKQNPLQIFQLIIGIEGLNRDQAMVRAEEIAEKLGLEYQMSYIIRGFKEEK